METCITEIESLKRQIARAEKALKEIAVHEHTGKCFFNSENGLEVYVKNCRKDIANKYFSEKEKEVQK